MSFALRIPVVTHTRKRWENKSREAPIPSCTERSERVALFHLRKPSSLHFAPLFLSLFLLRGFDPDAALMFGGKYPANPQQQNFVHNPNA